MARAQAPSQHHRDAEFARQRALDAYRIVDTLPETAFDDIARLAATVCDAPVALVSLVDRDRQWFKAQVGTDVHQTPRDGAVCDYAIRTPTGLFEVPDLARDPRFADYPSVAGVTGARFYAGMPLVTPGGTAIGAVCVVDRKPRRLVPAQREALASLARLTINLLEDRHREQLLIRAAILAPAAGNEEAPPANYRVVLIQVQGHAELVEERGERIAEKTLRSFDQALEACLPPGAGNTIDRATDHAEFVAILRCDKADETLACLRHAVGVVARGAGLTVVVGSADSENPQERLESVYARADEALSVEKDKLHPPPVAA